MIEILNKIRAGGGTIEVVGGDLRLRVPRGLLSDQDRRLLVERKPELITLLAADTPVVVQIEISGDELRLHCPTAEIAGRIEAGRQQVEQVLAQIAQEQRHGDRAEDGGRGGKILPGLTL
jgi:hypothetical protein